ncbi:hypothetical protein HBI88_082290 [Parastagonospora nodorum]|nr:hypothetical protein HBI46_049990 [Parastagonospora nodorum]KAH5790554.1 hypothetical protein HBI97_057930 [Parastagonospora nodorum]KAH5812736.1 hypothetical protein HBI96_080030 [Parastagonospora nodorum]KAH5823731.1 hypothetical protein HBI94_087880 [Parastagonospora nodorum]KAH5835633.1 hypothetical protein HBI93_095970 [Parastagonospora nodorum]
MFGNYLTGGLPHAMPSLMAPAMPSVEPVRVGQCKLVVRQQPYEALVSIEGKEKSRKPIDPPPIVELQVNNPSDPGRQWLQSPYFFVVVDLIENGRSKRREPDAMIGPLTGTLTSSLHRLKDSDNIDKGFTVFADVSVTLVGTFRLRFSLFELQRNGTMSMFLASVDSEEFNVVAAKDFKGMAESSVLSRSFSDQGVRLRLRKEPRGLSGNKRKHGAAASEEKDKPDRQNQTSDPSSYDEESSPVKRYKYETDERKDSLPTVPHANVNSSANMNSSTNMNSSAYSNPSLYNPLPSYTSPSHALSRQTALPTPSHSAMPGYNFSNVGLQGNFPRTTMGASQQYQQRLPVTNSPALYSQQMYQNPPNSTISNGLSHNAGGLSQNTGYSNDSNVFKYVGQRIYPTYPDNNDFDGNPSFHHGQ